MNLPPFLFLLPTGIETRWASPENPEARKGEAGRVNKGRKGKPNIVLKAGEDVVMAQASASSGIVRRIWATLHDRSPAVLRGLRIDIYWDGAPTPAVSAPFADFFGQGLGRNQTFESSLFSNPEGRSFNCVIPMPFLTGFRIVLFNESPNDVVIFYDVNYTLGDRLEGPSYLHAHWRREAPTTLLRDYEVLPKLTGRGLYLGANFGVIADTKTYLDSWWGEGECKIFLDGDASHPTLAGTGTEDYIGTAWGQGQYGHLYQGCHLADSANGQYAFYRYHVPDPVYFQRDIRVAFQQIGVCSAKTFGQFREAGLQLVGGGSNPAGEPLDMHPPVDAPSNIFERTDDWSSCCYFYLDRPENNLPPLAAVTERTSGLLASSHSAIVGGVANP
jgi:hypothetical protein